MVASVLLLGPCGAVSLGGMVLMEFHLSLVSLGGLWFCGSGVGVFFFPFGFLGIHDVWAFASAMSLSGWVFRICL